MKPFVFKNFSISQSENVFRVGTDGVLLGALAQIQGKKRVLEAGSGTGLISMMLAQRNPEASFLALDINPEAVGLSTMNFKNSPFSERMKAVLADYKDFEPKETFDFIVSNPPYFEVSGSSKDKIARQTVELNFSQLISKSAELLSKSGIFSVIIPAESGDEFIETAEQHHLFLIKRIRIKGIENSKVKRCILEFSRTETQLEDTEFSIEKSPRVYSDSYLELTKEFHIFK